MATTKAAEPAADASAGGKAQHWWQWFLVYPTLGIALLGAVPQWIDKGRAWYAGTQTATYSEAMKQNALWQKNFECSTAESNWYLNPRKIQVDATICHSGDLFVQLYPPGEAPVRRFVSIDDLMNKPESGGGLVPAAHAAEWMPVEATLRPGVRLAGDVASVLCQKFLDARMLQRRVSTPQGCFDEVIDTYNGQVVRRTPAPCTPQC